MSPKFSIIVPVYNVRGYIGTTLNSILAQTFRNFELLAVDDGSTDGSGEYLDSVARIDTRIRVFHQKNSGVSAARNLGLDKAHGEWIVFVDGDDALKTNALEILNNTIEDCPDADLVGYGFEKVKKISAHNTDNPIEISDSFDISNIKLYKYDCTETACFAALNHYMVWCEIYRRDLIKKIRFKPLCNGEDVLFCNEVGTRAKHYVEVRANLYLYLQRDQSAKSNEWNVSRQEDYFVLHNSIYENLTANTDRINNFWLKRWVGGLLYFEPKVWNFDKKEQIRCYKLHRDLLKKIKNIKGLPKILKFWIISAIAINSSTYYKITAMLPMRLYNYLRK